MRPFSRVLRALALLPLLAASFDSALAQKTAKEAEVVPEHNAYRPFRHPGPKHEVLRAFEGKWEAQITAWMHGSPPPKIEMRSTWDYRWVYGQRYIHGAHTLIQVAKEGEGAPVQVLGEIFLGHANERNEYFTYYFADEHVYPTYSIGHFDDTGKVLTLIGGEHDPVTGDDFKKIEIYRLEGPGQIGYELRYRFADGSEIKAAEGTYRRLP